MARESKATRDARRFGGTPTLADLAINTPVEWWMHGPHLDEGEAHSCIAQIQKDIALSKIVVAQNVSDFYFEHEREYWEYANDFPCSSPPFSQFFIEASKPKKVVIGNEISGPDKSAPDRFGILFAALDCRGRKVPMLKPGEFRSSERPEDIELREVSGARWVMRALPIFQYKNRPVYLSGLEVFLLNEQGRIIGSPAFIHSGYSLSQDMTKALHKQIAQFSMPMLLAISFMHCKNVEITESKTDKNTARERRKARLKPLVRYSTISIEPMKKVLKTEGNMESEGLQRALHICRGHFSTYSEEKPLFGRVAGTFWIPSHVRGSIKEGVVISDYNVKSGATS